MWTDSVPLGKVADENRLGRDDIEASSLAMREGNSSMNLEAGRFSIESLSPVMLEASLCWLNKPLRRFHLKNTFLC